MNTVTNPMQGAPVAQAPMGKKKKQKADLLFSGIGAKEESSSDDEPAKMTEKPAETVQIQQPQPQTDVMDLLDMGGASSTPQPQQPTQPAGNVLDSLFGGSAPQQPQAQPQTAALPLSPLAVASNQFEQLWMTNNLDKQASI